MRFTVHIIGVVKFSSACTATATSGPDVSVRSRETAIRNSPNDDSAQNLEIQCDLAFRYDLESADVRQNADDRDSADVLAIPHNQTSDQQYDEQYDEQQANPQRPREAVKFNEYLLRCSQYFHRRGLLPFLVISIPRRLATFRSMQCFRKPGFFMFPFQSLPAADP